MKLKVSSLLLVILVPTLFAACGSPKMEQSYAQPCANFASADRVSEGLVVNREGVRISCIPSSRYFGSVAATTAADSNFDAKVYLSPEGKTTCAETYKNGELAISTPAGRFCVNPSYFANVKAMPRARNYGFQTCTMSASDCKCLTLQEMSLTAPALPGLKDQSTAGFCY